MYNKCQFFPLKWLPNPDQFSRPKCLTKSYQSSKSYQILNSAVNVHEIKIKNRYKYLHWVKASWHIDSSPVTQVVPRMLYNLTYSETDESTGPPFSLTTQLRTGHRAASWFQQNFTKVQEALSFTKAGHLAFKMPPAIFSF
jgi:hypothetical protein